ncbi:MAG: hypothetical protein QCI38_07685 [Candidatus Thermoplasmatota archaeon]|nr:hypothetical protein [Candidatus Thermoplasmatota archaeon]
MSSGKSQSRKQYEGEYEKRLSKAVLALAIIGAVVMALGVYMAKTIEPLMGAGVIFAGAFILIRIMSRALL